MMHLLRGLRRNTISRHLDSVVSIGVPKGRSASAALTLIGALVTPVVHAFCLHMARLCRQTCGSELCPEAATLLDVEIGLARLRDPFLSKEVYFDPFATSNVRPFGYSA